MSPVAMMRSGRAAATAAVSIAESTVGLPDSADCFQLGSRPLGAVSTTGCTPRDSTASASPGPSAATARGATATSVLPCTCTMSVPGRRADRGERAARCSLRRR